MLVLPQELTHSQSPASLAMLTAALSSANAGAVVLDCSALERFDSSALAVLLGVNRAAHKAGKSLTLRACPERLTQLADVYGVLELFQLEASGVASTAAA